MGVQRDPHIVWGGLEVLVTLTAEGEIRRRIRERGPITFAQFMELALYWPHGGYYRGAVPTGADGDFYSSPGSHPAFGALLATQLYQMWRLLGHPSPFWVVDAGAGGGLLCHDLVSYARRLPDGFQRCLRYVCADLRAVPAVEAQLPGGLLAGVDRVAAHGLPLRGLQGCILSNELLDSFPVHRVEVRGGRLREVYVALEGESYREELGEPSTAALEKRLKGLSLRLPEGYSTEINLAMEPWLQGAAHALQMGYVLTIDYGRKASELYSVDRSRGTLTCFYRHSQTDNPYVHVGKQDITAQVDFSTLVDVGEDQGLKPMGYLPQGQFLTNLGMKQMAARLLSMGLGQQERDANRMGMLDLIHPGGLGGFKVLVQGRNAPVTPLWGAEGGEELEGLLEGLSVPLLTSHHVPLLKGRYPHLAVEWEGLVNKRVALQPPSTNEG